MPLDPGTRLGPGHVVAVVLLLLALGRGGGAQEWTRWGGPNGDFSVVADDLAESWPEEGPPLLWQRPLGGGYSSILHRDGALYTAYRDDNEEVVVAIDASSGATRWTHRGSPTTWPEMDRQWGVGPNTTPLLLGDRLVAVDIGGTAGGLDAATGELLWERDLPADFGRLPRPEEYGYSASPLPHGGRAILAVGGDRHAVVALDPADGSLVWGSEPGSLSYGPPSLVRLAGRDQYVYFELEGMVALDPATGETLWRSPIGDFPKNHNGNHLTPAVRCDDRHLWVGSQWPTGGSRLLEIVGEGAELSAEVVWQEPKGQTAQWTMTRVGDQIYGSLGTNRSSLFSALSWKTGELLWRERGFHKAQVLRLLGGSGDDRLLLLTESGDLILARASAEGLEILTEASILDSKAWTIPTLVGEILYVRDEHSLRAFDLGAGL